MSRQPGTQPAGSAASTGARSLLARLRSPDFLIAAVLFGVFAAAFVAAREWPADSRLFPHMVSIAGMGLAVLRMVTALRPPPAVEVDSATRVSGVELADEDDEEDQALEYVFARASRTDWLRALSWAAAFFLGLLLVGTVSTVLVFTILYLLRVARTSVLVALVYAAALAGMLFGAQELLDFVLPRGILFD